MQRVWEKGEEYAWFWWGNLRERPRRRWEDNIKMDLQEIGCGGMDWIELAQDRDTWRGTCECGNEHSGCIKCWEILDQLKTGQLLNKVSAPWSKSVLYFLALFR